MIVPFRIDPASFIADLHDLFPSQERRSHEDLLEIWERNGLLVYNGNEINQSYLLQNIKNLPADLRKNWELAIMKLPRIKSKNTNWDGCVSKKNVLTFLENPSIVIIQEDLAVKEFDIPEKEYSLIVKTSTGNIEVLKFPFISRSEVFKKSKLLYNSHINTKEPFEKIWMERFHWLSAAENVHHVSVIDRYALQNSFEKVNNNEICGSERFIKLLNRSATSKKYLRLYTSWGLKRREEYGDWVEQVYLDKLVNSLKSRLGNHIREITLEILKSSQFTDEHHDRHVRFEEYIWDIGKGLYCLQGSTVCKEKMTTAYKSGIELAKEYKLKEADLSRKNTKTGNNMLYKITSNGFQKIQ